MDFRYISNETYPATYFPAFCHGGMWTARGKILKDLNRMAEVTDRDGFHLEDVYITGKFVSVHIHDLLNLCTFG